jgi:POT family proton-dependent oligopeptide transporter
VPLVAPLTLSTLRLIFVRVLPPSEKMGLVTGLASLFAGDFSGMIPEPTGTTAIATNPGYAKLFAELGAGSLAVGIALVVLIPFLRKLITDKAETRPIEAATVVPVA